MHSFRARARTPDFLEEFLRQLLILKIEPDYTERFVHLWNLAADKVLSHQEKLKTGTSKFENINARAREIRRSSGFLYLRRGGPVVRDVCHTRASADELSISGEKE